MAMGAHDAENNLLLTEVENATVNEKGYVPDELRTQIFRKLRARQENRTCFDCPARNPTWLSLSHGCYVCLVCSGEHRRMGVHISFVRSVELDSFTKEQLVQMIVGGNGKARSYLKSIGIEGKRKDADGSGRKCDYYDKSTLKYRQQLEKETHTQCKALGIQVAAAAAAAGGPSPPTSSFEPATSSTFPQPGQQTQPPPMISTALTDSSTKPLSAENTPTANELANELFKGFNKPAVGITDSQNGPPGGGTGTAAQAAPVLSTMSLPPGRTSSHVSDHQPTLATETTHFAASGGGKIATAKATELADDFDFDFFEQEATKPIETKVLDSRPVEATYGLPDSTPAPVPIQAQTVADQEISKPQVFGFGAPAAAAPPAPVAVSAQLSQKKGFGSDDLFSNGAVSNGAPQASADPFFRNKTAFGSAALFGQDEAEPRSQGSDKLAQYMDKGQEMARQGAEKMKDMLSNYLKRHPAPPQNPCCPLPCPDEFLKLSRFLILEDLQMEPTSTALQDFFSLDKITNATAEECCDHFEMTSREKRMNE
ncbi:unnamed protein product, partial [Amoebophrya sp. A120]|eukprot:GSA120T00000124001.1